MVFDAVLRRQPAGERRRDRRAARRRHVHRAGHRDREQGDPLRVRHRPRRHRRRLGAGLDHLRRRRFRAGRDASCPVSRSATRSPRRCSSSARSRCSPPDLVVGIQDLGGAGLSCATSELASAGDGGMLVDLDQVPLRADGMTAAEILSSESQERMCAVVTPDKVDAFLAVCAKWEVQADVHRRGDRHRPPGDHPPRRWSSTSPPRTVAHDGPVLRRPARATGRSGRVAGQHFRRAGRVRRSTSSAPLVLRMAGSPNLCSRGWVTDQYDRYVRGNTVLAQPADAGIVRVADDSMLGLAMATDCNGRFTMLDPYAGAQLALAEAYRNVAITGAVPLGGHRLPELRLARGPGGDVAVPAGRARPGRRLRRARDPGHRRQCQLLQPDRRHGHPAHPGGRRARRDRRRPAPDRHRNRPRNRARR